MPERLPNTAAEGFRAGLEAHQRRLRLASIASAVLAAAAAGSLAAIALWMADVGRITVAAAASVVALSTAAGLTWVAWARLRLADVAHVLERSAPLDNLVVTAEEILARRTRHLRPALESEVFQQALARLDRLPPPGATLLGRPAALALAAAAAFTALLAGLPQRTVIPDAAVAPALPADRPLAAGDLRVVITPPAYIRRETVTAINPESVTALEGSRVRLEVPAATGVPVLVDAAREPVPFGPAGAVFAHEFTAVESQALLVRAGGDRQPAHDRLVYVAVQSDARPIVTIRAPAKDLLFGEATGSVAVEIEARDDVALEALTLRFTRVSGSGEGFTFNEGTLPVEIARPARTIWNGRSTIALAALGLEEGDTLVYQAAARDQKPGTDASLSESFLIEIGKAGGVASTGFALPDDRERQGLSQQMVIVKTERLEAQRKSLSSEAFTEQSRLLGIEQRMVRAEFVFMTGGEVEDEVEEAAGAHELTEGRLENRGQAELLAAVREMSRAEARLNASDTTGALVFERAALRALQRAFDRRRYLLRTTPERARIDLQRRLTGDLSPARSTEHERREAQRDPLLVRARAAMGALAGHDIAAALDPALAAQVLAVDPASAALRTAILELSAAQTEDARRAAATAVGRALLELVQARVGPASPNPVPSDSLRGRMADELTRLPR